MAKSKLRNQTSINKDSSRKQHNVHKKEDNHSKNSIEKNPNKDDHIYERQAVQLFPRFTPLLVFVVTLTFRVLYVMDPKNLWMIHPDEVYQSVEVAHIEVYGYGFRTYEFSPPETPTEDTTKYRQMQLKAHMYALRSPIFPYFYVLASWLASLGGINANPYMIWRVAHVIISSLLPVTVYLFVSRLYGVKNKGCVASILVATSVHLNVFSTHCFLHSFLAPFTFLALSMLIDTSVYDNTLTSLTNNYGSLIAKNEKMTSANELPDQKKQEDRQNNNNTVTTNMSQKEKNYLKRNEKSTASHKSNCLKNVYSQHTQSGTEEKNDKGSQQLIKIAASPMIRTNHAKTAVAAFISALICYIRPDVLIVYILNVIVFPQLRQILLSKNWAAVVLGVSAALALGASVDFCYYGWGVSSPVNWINFNVISGFSTLIFGQMSYRFYIDTFFGHDVGIISLSVCTILIFCVLQWKNPENKSFVESNNKDCALDSDLINCNLLNLKSLLTWLVLFIVYSLNGHKETRFIHDAIIFVFIFIADVLVNLKYLFHSRLIGNNVIRMIVMVFAITQWRSFPTHSNNFQWVYHKTVAVQDVNLCIKYISEQNDVTGVFYDVNLHMTGGTSLLHHNVTIMSVVEDGFYEFGLESRKNYIQEMESVTSRFTQSKNRSSVTLIKSVNDFTRATNYIALANAQAVLRVIIKKPVYNYFILQKDRRFLEFGFVEVFSTKRSRVLRRILDAKSEYSLQGLLDKISVGNNATVLLHEGDVLFNMNQYYEASTRFYQALHLDPNILEAYLPLQICYSKLGDDRAARAVQGHCQSLFDKASCTTPRKITRL